MMRWGAWETPAFDVLVAHGHGDLLLSATLVAILDRQEWPGTGKSGEPTADGWPQCPGRADAKTPRPLEVGALVSAAVTRWLARYGGAGDRPREQNLPGPLYRVKATFDRNTLPCLRNELKCLYDYFNSFTIGGRIAVQKP